MQQRQLDEGQLRKKEQLLDAGHQAFDEDEFTLALDCYHRASLLDGADAKIWTALAMTYANLDLVREAWRSYKLALVTDSEDVETVWYAAEFLFNIEDFMLARPLLERYISLEQDPERLTEAGEMLADAERAVDNDDELRERPRYTGSDDPDDVDDNDELEGFGFEDEDDEHHADKDDDNDDEDYPLENDQFVANLDLQLSGMGSKCPQCGTGIPLDAPHCYSCNAPHIYEDE